MLEVLLKALENGPVETGAIIHTVHVSQLQKLKIHAADTVGIVAQRWFSGGIMTSEGWGAMNGYPWSSVAMINFPKAD